MHLVALVNESLISQTGILCGFSLKACFAAGFDA